MLLQQLKDGSWRPVFYYSCSNTPADSSYHSYELETLALVETMRRFTVYLVGIHFKAVTRCSDTQGDTAEARSSSSHCSLDGAAGIRHGVGVQTRCQYAACECSRCQYAACECSN